MDPAETLNTGEAVSRLSALAHPTRLDAFRLLMEAGLEGLRAGELSERLDVAPNTMSAHFNVLARADLVRMRRNGRMNIYTVNLEATAELLSFLAAECCHGHPEVCAPLGDAIRAAPPIGRAEP